MKPRPLRSSSSSRRSWRVWGNRGSYDSHVLVGAILGLLIGLALSFYVGRLDYQKRQSGLRTRAHYRASLFVVPAVFAGLGALIGAAIA